MPDIIVSVANEKDIEQLYREYACTELVHCSDCRNRQESNVAGFFYCDAWGKDLNASVYDPNKYFCAEGERE